MSAENEKECKHEWAEEHYIKYRCMLCSHSNQDEPKAKVPSVETIAKKLWEIRAERMDDPLPFEEVENTNPLKYKFYIEEAQAIRKLMNGEGK